MQQSQTGVYFLGYRRGISGNIVIAFVNVKVGAACYEQA
jgi:hypothetical protein